MTETPYFGTDGQLRQAYALRALLMHFRDQFDLICAAGGIDADSLNAFMRLNATEKKIRSNFDAVKGAFAKYARAKQVSLHRDVRALYRVVFDRHPFGDDLPRYISEGGIETAYFRSKEGVEDFLAPIEGCWRVYRASSTSRGPSINRAFLNIKPAHILVSENSFTPKFSMYYSEDGRDPGHATGALYATSGRINFVGARVNDNTQHVLTMVWRHNSEGLGEHQPESTGVLMAPNTEGDQIATNVLAVFMRESKGLKRTDYDALKAQERSRCGTFAIDRLQDPLTDGQQSELAALIERGVFRV